ncbi:MAG: hypothetical protein ACRDPO_32720 [Streptosporangiaceae bacterium]
MVLVLAAAGAGWALFRGPGGHPAAGGTGPARRPTAHPASSSSPGSLTSPAAGPSGSVSSPAPSTSAPSGPATSASDSPTGGPGPGATTPVALGPGVSQDSSSHQLDAFASRYFSAINDHDYQAYIALLAPGGPQVPTPGQFAAGYGSTSDTGATLTSTAPQGGGYAIGLSFLSHQSASQSKTGTSCTAWQITLYLVPGGGSYLIASPPPGYHSTYRACS